MSSPAPTFTGFTAFLDHLRELALEDAGAFVDDYLRDHARNFPLIEGNTAHFLYRASGDEWVGIDAEWNGFDDSLAPMQPVGGGLLHYEREFAPGSRLSYRFVTRPAAGQEPYRLILDPFNPRVGETFSSACSELWLSDYTTHPAIERQAGTPIGHLERGLMIKSVAFGETRPYTVYLPDRYRADSPAYPSAYFHDRTDYLNQGAATAILDNLIAAGTIPPIMAIFTSPVERLREYDCSPQHLQFMAEELLADVRTRYNVSDDATRTAVIGDSRAGTAALFLASQRPDLFGLVGSQSGLPNSTLTDFDARQVYASDPCLAVKLHLSAGSYEDCYGVAEGGKCYDLLTPIREFRDVLAAHDYEHDYREYPQGHSWGLWRDSLADTLTFLFNAALDASNATIQEEA